MNLCSNDYISDLGIIATPQLRLTCDIICNNCNALMVKCPGDAFDEWKRKFEVEKSDQEESLPD